MTTRRSTPFHLPAWLFGTLLLVMSALWCCGAARAQDREDPADPPARVGRLADVEGEVYVFDSEEGEWVEAARNRPVTTGDRLSSSGGGRAEVRVGSTTVRMDANTEVEFRALDDDHVTLELHSGDVAVRLRTREAAQAFELHTPEGVFQPERAGSYRVTRDDDTTQAATLSGQLQLRAPDAGVTVKAGQLYRFWRDNGTQFELSELRRDGFDDWVAAREDREERSVSARYVSSEMTGVEDLDRYGRWEQDAEYGALWIPRDVAPGWAPYRAGHWTWIHPWGWTWVDDAPWGFAPFHYGRWVSRGGAWCWTPGRYVARPVYAPALVAWVGGGGAGVSVGVGRRPPPTVGWFPLGPREVYVPGHRFTPHYMRHVNDNHVNRGFDYSPFYRDPRRAVEHGHYRHRGLPQAVTVVPRDVIERRRPVGPAIISVSGRPVPGFERDRPRPDAPVMPGGRPPSASRPGAQVGIPAAPGSGGDRFGDRRPGREHDDRRLRGDAPASGNPGRDVHDRERPGLRPGFSGNEPGRQAGYPSGRDDLPRTLRPVAPPAEASPRPSVPPVITRPEDFPAPVINGRRTGGFNHMRPPQDVQQAPQVRPLPVRPEPVAPQVHRPPPQLQPPAQRMPQGAESRRDRGDDVPRHRRVD